MASFSYFEGEEGVQTTFQTARAEVSSARAELVIEAGWDQYSSGPTQKMMGDRALVVRVVDAFGDEVKASRWLSLPNRDLNGRTPLQVAQESGYNLQAIEPILTRIEHGVEF